MIKSHSIINNDISHLFCVCVCVCVIPFAIRTQTHEHTHNDGASIWQWIPLSISGNVHQNHHRSHAIAFSPFININANNYYCAHWAKNRWMVMGFLFSHFAPCECVRACVCFVVFVIIEYPAKGYLIYCRSIEVQSIGLVPSNFHSWK